MLRGSQVDEMSVLDVDYNIGDQEVQLRYPKPNVQPGTMISVGLNSFIVLATKNSGQTFTVFPKADGGPEVDVAHGELIRIRPAYTTWAILRQWNGALTSMSSPVNGITGYGMYESVPDYVANVYPLPDTAPWTTRSAIRVQMAQYLRIGIDQWVDLNGVHYLANQRTIQVTGATPDAVQLRFLLSFPFDDATSLATDTATLGLTAENEDIPGLGAAQVLALGDEGRRAQPVHQGDPRRAGEVQAGANVGVSRAFGAQFKSRMVEEHARQQSLYPYRLQMAVNGG